eukprot:5992655-Heterocapsa_arctica.AAC.1
MKDSVDFPTDLKYKLFHRWCNELCEMGTGDMSLWRQKAILDMVTPWPVEGCDAGFDALLPRLGTMEG